MYLELEFIALIQDMDSGVERLPQKNEIVDSEMIAILIFS